MYIYYDRNVTQLITYHMLTNLTYITQVLINLMTKLTIRLRLQCPATTASTKQAAPL